MKKIALVGIGEIAKSQHIPSLNASKDWQLCAAISRSGTVEGISNYTDFDVFLIERTDIETVSLCVPPQPRFDYAAKAMTAGKNVMLEKPPGQTLSEVHALQKLAAAAGVTLFATWHSRAASGVETAKDWLSGKFVTSGQIIWKESVRKYHMDQDWIFEPGGMGVFDPGINALSILTEILPSPTYLTNADLWVPKNRDTPILAKLGFANNIHAVFDWTVENEQQWDIVIETKDGILTLTDGGAKVMVDGALIHTSDDVEYPNLYKHMSTLVDASESDVDLSPMVFVSDAFTIGKTHTADAFHF